MTPHIHIANALNVSTDELLCNYIRQAKDIVNNGIPEELTDCNDKELKVIKEAQTIKRTLRKAYSSD